MRAVAGMARAIPNHAIVEGRSPRRTPTSVGTAAAVTAETGATTEIRPIEKPRYRHSTPNALPTPARAPHSIADVEFDDPEMRVRIKTTIPATPCENIETSVALLRREHTPAMKSANP
jgi:hypothetical protein